MGRRLRMVAATGRIGLGIGAFFLLACASGPRRGGGPTSTDFPPAIGSVYVRSFNGEFNRVMRETVVAGLQRSPRVRVVDAEADAAFVLSGVIALRMLEMPGPSRYLSAEGSAVELRARTTGQVVWQYRFRDERPGGEVVDVTPEHQVRVAARQFVAELTRVTFPVRVDDPAKF